jgi:hypothetical protein
MLAQPLLDLSLIETIAFNLGDIRNCFFENEDASEDVLEVLAGFTALKEVICIDDKRTLRHPYRRAVEYVFPNGTGYVSCLLSFYHITRDNR